MAEALDGVKDFYYLFEDRYYEVLDKINEKIPVYNIIDPIDRRFPSFILVLIIAALLIFALSLLVFGGPGGPLEPISNLLWELFAPIFKLLGLNSASAKFVVLDAKGKLVKGLSVSFSLGKDSQTKETDSFGEFQTDFFGKGVTVEINDPKYKRFSQKMDINPGKLYKIELAPAQNTSPKNIGFELRDDTGPINANTDVTISFSCSNAGISPASVSGKGPSHRALVQSNCGLLTATVGAVGYNDERKVIDVAAQDGTVSIKLSRKKLYASVRVIVRDKVDQKPVANVKLNLKAGDVTQIDAGYTDSAGSKVIDRVPSGSYFIEALPPESLGYQFATSNEFTVGAAMFADSSGVTVTIELEKPTNAKKAIVKFIDSNSNKPIAGANATLIAAKQSSGIVQTSGQEGIVQFVNLSADKNYGLIVFHKDYLLKVVDKLALSGQNESKSQEIKLEKATSSNSGKAKVVVREYGGGGVANAQVGVFMNAYQFPVYSGATSSSGVFDVNNVPIGNYKAKATKDADGIPMQATSETKKVNANATTQFDLTLVLASGEIEVKVIDPSGKPVKDANVIFMDYISGKKLESGITGDLGKLVPQAGIKFKVDKRPYMIVEKDKYYRSVTRSYTLNPGEKRSVEVTLNPQAPPSNVTDFDILYSYVLNEAGTQKVTTLDDNKTYNFVFNLTTDKHMDNVQALIRAGSNSQPNASDGIIAIKNIQSPFSDVTYSACFDSSDNYKECNAQGATLEAKQGVITAPGIEPGSYEIMATVFIKEVPDAAENNALVEMHYGTKGKAADSDKYRPQDPKSLYHWQQKLHQAICQRNCGFVISMTLKDAGLARELGGTPVQLLQGNSYGVDFTVNNISGKKYENAILSLKNAVSSNPLELSAPSVSIGTLGQGETKSGSFAFTAKTGNAADLNASLNLNEQGDTLIAKFTITPLQMLKLSAVPDPFPSQVPSNFAVHVSNAQNADVDEAAISIFLKGDSVPLNLGNPKTDNTGTVLFTLGPFDDGTVLVARAEKSAYQRAEKEIAVRENVFAVNQGIDCVKINDNPAPVLLLNGRNKSTGFSVRNNCGSDLEISFAKDPESDIGVRLVENGVNRSTLQFGQFIALANNNSKAFEVNSDKELGVHPLYVKARYNNRQQAFDAALARVRIIDTSARLKIANLEYLAGDEDNGLGQFVLDFLDGRESFKIENSAYAGVEDTPVPGTSAKYYPNTDLYTKFAAKMHISSTGITRTETFSTRTFEATNLGISDTSISDPFFLITVEDYYEGME